MERGGVWLRTGHVLLPAAGAISPATAAVAASGAGRLLSLRLCDTRSCVPRRPVLVLPSIRHGAFGAAGWLLPVSGIPGAAGLQVQAAAVCLHYLSTTVRLYCGRRRVAYEYRPTRYSYRMMRVL